MKSKSVGIFFSLSSYHVGSVPFFLYFILSTVIM